MSASHTFSLFLAHSLALFSPSHSHSLSGAPSGEIARREISLALSVPLPSHSLAPSLSLTRTQCLFLSLLDLRAMRFAPHLHTLTLPQPLTLTLTLTLALTHPLAHSLSFSHSLKIFLSLFPIYLAWVLAVTQPSPSGRTAARACLEFSLIRTLTFIHTRSLTHSLTLILTHSHIGAQSGESLSRILSHTHTHIHTHSLTHSLTLILTHSHTHTLTRGCTEWREPAGTQGHAPGPPPPACRNPPGKPRGPPPPHLGMHRHFLRQPLEVAKVRIIKSIFHISPT